MISKNKDLTNSNSTLNAPKQPPDNTIEHSLLWLTKYKVVIEWLSLGLIALASVAISCSQLKVSRDAQESAKRAQMMYEADYVPRFYMHGNTGEGKNKKSNSVDTVNILNVAGDMYDLKIDKLDFLYVYDRTSPKNKLIEKFFPLENYYRVQIYPNAMKGLVAKLQSNRWPAIFYELESSALTNGEFRKTYWVEVKTVIALTYTGKVSDRDTVYYTYSNDRGEGNITREKRKKIDKGSYDWFKKSYSGRKYSADELTIEYILSTMQTS